MINSILWNLFGTGVPLGIAAWAIPHLLFGYGDERFGLLSIVWALIGYFSIFDLGLGRALTKLVAERHDSHAENEIPDLVKTAMVLMVGLGILAGLLCEVLAPVLIRDMLKLNDALTPEGVGAMRVLSIGLPFVVLSAALIGLLEAHNAFKEINIIRFIMGASNFVGPVICLRWSHSLVLATAVMVAVRILTTAFYWHACVQKDAFGSSKGRFAKNLIRPLFGFGAWITVSNVISPLMVQLDRFIIGATIGVARLPVYVVPSDILNRLSFFPAALINVLFPAFARVWGKDDAKGAGLYKDSSRLMFWTISGLALLVSGLAPEGLKIWMGSGFSHDAAPIVRILVVGFFINGLARLPHLLLQSSGRPDITAKLHIVEFPIYIVSLFLLLKYYGILGGAIGWTARMCLDMLLLTASAGKVLPTTATVGRRLVLWGGGFTVVLTALPLLDGSNAKFPAIAALLMFGFYKSMKSLSVLKSSS